MKPVMQTRISGPLANCFTACLASILELAIEDIPDFYRTVPASQAIKETNRWLAHRDLQLVTLRSAEHLLPKAYMIAEGLGPRGRRHAVVHFGDVAVHDPHPSGEGLKAVDVYRLFVAVHPHKVT